MMEFPFAEMINNPWIKILSKYPTQKDREALRKVDIVQL
ncbi:hypothetical protein Vdis_1967 [Vulcanisaeta distributa DSM 14429]|uniref:Uncharacterized protein n=1 Tax=Vulcanisaeta distributa (strain DSM 14429 / JCM 11212 / NBRC 100878 / IC-017) TaxID=572478 RepID=E1QNX4_VULDI|nr:hypothetical protein Vdis_1967 [Vulcanisaeta distributa DSM 14429]